MPACYCCDSEHIPFWGNISCIHF